MTLLASDLHSSASARLSDGITQGDAGPDGELLSPDNGAMPFGVGLPFAVLVFPGCLGGDGEGSVGGALGVKRWTAS